MCKSSWEGRHQIGDYFTKLWWHMQRRKVECEESTKTSSKKSSKVLLEKEDRTGKRWVSQIHLWSPGPLGWKVSRQQEAQMFEDWKEMQRGTWRRGNRTREELVRQAGDGAWQPCKLKTWCVLFQERASLIAQLVKNMPAMQEMPVQFLGQEEPLEKG